MQLSGCTEKCKAGNSLKNGAKAAGKARKQRRREAESLKGKEAERKGSGEAGNGARSGREGTGKEAESPKGKEAEKKGTEKKQTERREAGNSRLRVRERTEAKRRASGPKGKQEGSRAEGKERNPPRKSTGGNDGEVPPVPIPNTEVKLSSAESTWLDTAREDRSLPVPL